MMNGRRREAGRCMIGRAAGWELGKEGIAE